MRNIFKRIIVPTAVIITLFLAADEIRLPVGLCLTTALIGLWVTVASLLSECKKMQFKTTPAHLIKGDIAHCPLKKVCGQIKYKDKKLVNKTEHLPKSPSYSVSRFKRK